MADRERSRKRNGIIRINMVRSRQSGNGSYPCRTADFPRYRDLIPDQYRCGVLRLFARGSKSDAAWCPWSPASTF